MKSHERKSKQNEVPRRSYFRIMTLGAAAITGLTGLGLLAYENQPTGNTINSHHPRAEYEAVPTWRQDFLATRADRPDPKVWRYDTNYRVPSYNDEKQAYTTSNKNVRIEQGVGLVVEAHHEPYTYEKDPQSVPYEYTSGRIDTRKSFNFEYGKIEATMKLPEGAGTWPAFWLLSANEPHTKGSPPSVRDDEGYYTKNGEIDIMESYGHTPGIVEGTVYTYANNSDGQIEIPDASTNFHTYGVEVAPDSITWTVDDRPYYSVTKQSDDPDHWPFGNGNRLYAILNLAMGGTGGGAIQNEHAPWRLEVRDLAYYPYTGQ